MFIFLNSETVTLGDKLRPSNRKAMPGNMKFRTPISPFTSTSRPLR